MSPLSLNTSSLPEVSMMQSLTLRRLLITVFAVFINAISALMIIKYTKLKRPLKVLLLNQIASDIVLMVSAMFYTLYQWNINADVCIFFVYFIIYGFVLSHASVMVMSLNNFLALFIPFKHSLIFTTKIALLTVVIIWIILALICTAIVGIKIKSGLICAPLIVIPDYGLLILFVVFFILDSSVIGINISLCLKLRMRIRVHAMTENISMENGMLRHRKARGLWRTQNKEEHAMEQPSTSQTRPNGENQDSNSTSSQLSSVRNLFQTDKPGTAEFWDKSDEKPKANDEVPSNIKELETTKCRVNSEHDRMEENNQSLVGLPLQGHKNSVSANSHDRSPPRSSRLSPRLNSATIFTRRNTSSTYSRFRNLSMTMIIIAMWCSLLNIPYVVFMLYLGTADNMDRLKAMNGTFGLIAIKSLSVNALGDPFIYAWRFISWSTIFKIIQNKFRRNR